MTSGDKVREVARAVMKYRRGETPYDDSEGFDNALHLIDDIEAVVSEG